MTETHNSLVVGVDIGGTKVAAGLVDRNGEIKNQIRTPMVAHGEAGDGLAAVVSGIDLLFANNPTARTLIRGIGMCAPGPLDPATGVVINPPNVPCWRNFPLADEVEKVYRVPVKVENDANAAALAEAYWGAARGYDHIFYAGIGTGIGTGIVCHGRIYNGRTGAAAEGGHMSIDYDGPRCGCGKPGCIEVLAAGPAIARRARSKLESEQSPPSIILDLAKADLEYYDKIIDISRARFKAGDLAQIDLDRIELLRVQYESEIENAIVNLRTAKIQLLQMLNDRTPVDQFDVTGPFDFNDSLEPLDRYRDAALAARPDLQAALQTIQQSQTNHKLAISNGSTDPTYSAWYTHNASTNNPNGPQTLGVSVNIPLRIFDRNQGEKKRTQIDIDRSQQASDATRAQVFSDVDTAYELVRSNVALLKPYKEKYNDQALRVRDTVTFAYEHGGASLMDFLNAQSDYRQVQLAYAQLLGSYLTAEGQLTLAVGSEKLP